METDKHPPLTAADASAQLGVSHSTILRWVRAGRIATVTMPSGRRRIPAATVQDLLTEH